MDAKTRFRAAVILLAIIPSIYALYAVITDDQYVYHAITIFVVSCIICTLYMWKYHSMNKWLALISIFGMILFAVAYISASYFDGGL